MGNFILWEKKILDGLSRADKPEFFRLLDAQNISRKRFYLLSQVLLVVGIILFASLLQHRSTGHNAAGLQIWVLAMLFVTACRIINLFVNRSVRRNRNTFQASDFIDNFFHALIAVGFGLIPLICWPQNDVAGEFIVICSLIIYSGISSDNAAGFTRLGILFGGMTILPLLVRLFFLESELGAVAGGLVGLYLVYISVRVNGLAQKKVAVILDRIHTNTILAEAQETILSSAQTKKTKADFLAAASHDLRQPIHAARLFVSTLETLDPSEKEARADIIEKINLAFTGMEGMLDSLLSISYLNSESPQMSSHSFSLNPLIVNLYLELSDIASEKNVELKICPSSFDVETDRRWLERLLRNLIGNAIKYAPGGKVLIGVRKKGQFARVLVIDNGSGIPDDQVDQIFEEFRLFQKEGIDGSGSLGLGLAIVNRIAKLLHLKVSVTSKVGRGTAFCVDIPLSVGDTAQSEPLAAEANRRSFDRAL